VENECKNIIKGGKQQRFSFKNNFFTQPYPFPAKAIESLSVPFIVDGFLVFSYVFFYFIICYLLGYHQIQE